MTALPEWIKNIADDCCVQQCETPLIEALAIAWEALGNSCKDVNHEYMTPKGRIEEKPCKFEDAMSSIAALGKE